MTPDSRSTNTTGSCSRNTSANSGCDWKWHQRIRSATSLAAGACSANSKQINRAVRDTSLPTVRAASVSHAARCGLPRNRLAFRATRSLAFAQVAGNLKIHMYQRFRAFPVGIHFSELERVMYHPVLGAFLSRDPLPDSDPILMGSWSRAMESPKSQSSAQSTSLYAYVSNNPPTRLTPQG